MGETSEIKMRWLATFKSKRYANPLSLLLLAQPFPNPQFRLFRGNKKGNYSLQRGLSRRKCVYFNTKTPLTYIFIVACVFLERIYYKKGFSSRCYAHLNKICSAVVVVGRCASAVTSTKTPFSLLSCGNILFIF